MLNLVGTSTAGDALQNALESDFAEISTLDLSRDTREGTAKSLLGRGVDHLASDGGGIRRPGEKDNLGALARVRSVVLKVVDSVSAVVLRKITKEVVVGLGVRGLGDHNLGLSIVKREDNVLVRLLELQVVEGSKRLVVNGNTRSRHCEILKGLEVN